MPNYISSTKTNPTRRPADCCNNCLYGEMYHGEIHFPLYCVKFDMNTNPTATCDEFNSKEKPKDGK